MDPALKARLTSRDLWMRLLYMILFAIAYSVAELVVTLVVIFQFVFILLTGSANEPLLRFGQNLTRYIADVIRFQTFNTEAKPFPFDDWPDDAPGGESWRQAAPDDETAVDVGAPVEESVTADDVSSADDVPSVDETPSEKAPSQDPGEERDDRAR